MGTLSGVVDYAHAVYFGLVIIFLSYPWLIYFINFVQILTGKQPFPPLDPDFRVVLHVQAGKRPERSSYSAATFTDSMWKLLVDCWDQDPENRPDMGTVVRRLEYM